MMMMKIGMATDLYHRLGAYQLCYPKEFTLVRIFTCDTPQEALQLERHIHQYMTAKKKYLLAEHSHAEEVFNISHDEVQQLLFIIEANRKTELHSNHVLFPYTKTYRGGTITMNLARGGFRVKPMDASLVTTVDDTTNAAIRALTPVRRVQQRGPFRTEQNKADKRPAIRLLSSGSPAPKKAKIEKILDFSAV